MTEPTASVTPLERARRYRELASGIEATIGTMENIPSFSQLKAAYEELAREWRWLAARAECVEILPPQLANATREGD